jgi:hypothetical protein
MIEAFRSIVRHQQSPGAVAERLQRQGQWTAEVREFVEYFTTSSQFGSGGLRQPGRVA